MARIPAMDKDEVEELIEDLSTHIGISSSLADDMLDAGHLVMWAANEADITEEEARAELNEVGADLHDFIAKELHEEDRELEIVILGLWMHIQKMEQNMREAPVEEDEGPDNPHDRMFA